MKKYILLTAVLSSFPLSGLFSQTWSSIGIGIQNTTADYTCVYTMLEFNNELYIGGCFTSVNGVPANYIAKFDGTNWSALGDGLWHTGNNNIIYTGVRTMTVFNGELYAGGIINQSGTTPVYNVAKWDGSSWIAVGGFYDIGDGVISLCVYNNELYAGGRMLNGYNSIGKWNGSSWLQMGTGMQRSNGTSGLVRDMIVYNNLLYIGGQYATGDGINSQNLITWNGTNFISVGSGANGTYGITRMGFFNNDLIVDGGFTEINGIPFNNIASYDNNSWSSFGTGTGSPGGSSYETQPILEYNNNMFVGGLLTTAGSTPVNNIAQWDGASWLPVGTGTNGYVGALINFQNELYAAGHFTAAGGVSANYIAKWTDGSFGINDNLSDHPLTIFPNPFSTHTTLHISESLINATITIDNNLGQTVRQITNINDPAVVIDRNNLGSGVYSVRLVNDNKIYTKRLVITDR